MRVDGYFTKVREAIESCSVAQLTDVALDKRSTHTGFIDDSILDGKLIGMRFGDHLFRTSEDSFAI